MQLLSGGSTSRLRPSHAQSLFPARPGRVEEARLIVGMLLDQLEVQIHAQPRRVGIDRCPLSGLIVGPRSPVARPGLIKRIEMLLDQEVWHDGGQLQADGRRDRAAALMRRDPGAVGAGEFATAMVLVMPPSDIGSG